MQDAIPGGQAQMLQSGRSNQRFEGCHFPTGTGVTAAHERSRNKDHTVVDKTDFVQTWNRKGCCRRQGDLLDASAAGRTMCWMAMQWEMLNGEALPRVLQHPGSAWGELEGRRSQTPSSPQDLMFWTSARSSLWWLGCANASTGWLCQCLLAQVGGVPVCPHSSVLLPRRRDGAWSPGRPQWCWASVRAGLGKGEGRVQARAPQGPRVLPTGLVPLGQSASPPTELAWPSPHRAPSSPWVFLEAKCCLIVKRQKATVGGEARRQR